MEVEAGHAVVGIVLLEVREVPRDQHRAHALQLHQQAVMPRRMAGRVEDDDRAVAKHILVTRQRLQLAAAADLVRERRHVGPTLGLGAVMPSQSPLPISTVAPGKDATCPVWSAW